MKAIKANRQYTITEADVKSFAGEGYDIYDDEGNLVKYGAGKTVPYEKYMNALSENENLKKEVESLNAEVAKLRTKKKEK